VSVSILFNTHYFKPPAVNSSVEGMFRRERRFREEALGLNIFVRMGSSIHACTHPSTKSYNHGDTMDNFSRRGTSKIIMLFQANQCPGRLDRGPASLSIALICNLPDCKKCDCDRILVDIKTGLCRSLIHGCDPLSVLFYNDYHSNVSLVPNHINF
jgi:hypothetical protein